MFGAAVAGGRGPTRFDQWGFDLWSPDLHNRLWVAWAKLDSPLFVAAGILICVLCALRLGPLAALVCIVAPAVTVVLAEAGKHGFDRELTGAPSYPSGTAAVAASLALLAALVVPGWFRLPVAVLGIAFVAGASVAVVALRWHYPTDAIGGVALGVGVVLIFHAGARWVAGRRPTTRSEP